MRTTVLLPTTLVLMLVLAACAPAPTAAPVASPSPAVAATPTAAPVTSPASPAAGATQVDVTLADNTIDSSLTTFQPGVPYTFVITNAGRHAHNFNISTPVEEAGSLDAALETALLAVEQSELSAGDSVTVDYTFPASAAGANLELSCLIARHYEDGMRVAITVAP